MAAEEKWYFAKKQLENSPSRKCDIDSDKELSYRQQAANFIQDVGQRLQVSQLCINTAIVYMHRFYVFHSFTQFHRYSMASAALFLAAKVEEQPRKLEHVIKVAHLCLHKEAESTTPATPDVKSEQYAQAAHDLVFNENVLLQTLGFDVAIDHPHTHVVRCCHLVKASKDLAQTSYFLASNSLHLTTMCLQYKPTVVACFCIHLACKWSNWEIPPSSEGKPWFTYVDESVTTEMLDELTKEFISIYNKCPSRLKKKIQSMSASLGQSSGGQSSGSQSSGHNSSGTSSNSQPVNCNSPMTADNKKLQSSQHKDGVNYHSKVHHNQLKPSIAHPHRPTHDPSLNYSEYKEKKERERQSMGAPGSSSHSSSIPSHHKQQIPGSQDMSKHPSSNSMSQNHKHGGIPASNTSSVPPNRNPHHRSSNSSNVDPKLKMHQQIHSQHSNRSAVNQSHPRMAPSGPEQNRNVDRDQLHREQSNHMRNSTGESSSRDHYRLQMNRGDITAPRDSTLPPPTSSTSIPPSSSSSSNITSERELLKEQQMRERHNAGGNALHLIDSLSKDNLLREVMDRSTPQTNNRSSSGGGVGGGGEPVHSKHRPDLFKDLFKDSNNSVNNSSDSIISEKQKYEQNKKLLNQQQNISATTAQTINNVKHESSASNRHNRSSSNNNNDNSVKSSSSSHSKPQQPVSSYNEQTQNKKQPQIPSSNVDKTQQHVVKSSSSSSSYSQQQNLPGGNTSSSSSSQPQMRVKQPPYNTNTSSTTTDSKSLTAISTSSPGLTNDHRNGTHTIEETKRPSSQHTDTMLTPPPSTYKQKSIFSPEKDTPKTPVKKIKTGKTPPNNSSGNTKKYETVLNDMGMIPPALSPFGSPPPVVTPSTPSAKNRNRTSSSSSEPELMVVINKLEYERYISKDKGVKMKEENVVPKDMKTKDIKMESSIKDENSVQMVNGIETADPVVISNLLKESATPSIINHLSTTIVDVKKEDEMVKEIIIPQVHETNVPHSSDVKKSDHHKSDKKKKKDKHKHKDKDRNREDKEKKKKHKDKDRDRQKSKDQTIVSDNNSTSQVAPLKITIPKDKITQDVSGFKIKIPKDRIKTDSISNSSSNQALGGLKIKISKDKIVENSSGGETTTTTITSSGGSNTTSSNRKRDRDNLLSDTTHGSGGGGPPTKMSKSSGYSSRSSSSTENSSRQNGRNSYNNKQQVSLGEGGQVGGVAVGVLQQQAQWSTQVKLAESKYHSKVPGSNKQPPT